jgi:hypothetical protein
VPERMLSTRALDRGLLVRQLSLARARVPACARLEMAGGLETQYAPSTYVGSWARLPGFRRELPTRALQQRRAV